MVCSEECLIQMNYQFNDQVFAIDFTFLTQKVIYGHFFFSFLVYIFPGEEQLTILKRV